MTKLASQLFALGIAAAVVAGPGRVRPAPGARGGRGRRRAASVT